MNDRVCAAVTGAKNFDYVFEFRRYGDSMAVKLQGSPCGVFNVTGDDLAAMAREWLEKWCARKKIRQITVFEPHNAAALEMEGADE